MSPAELQQDFRRPPATALAAGRPNTAQLVAEMRELRRQGEPADVWSVLGRHPDVPATRELLTDLACEEFSQRRAAGEELDGADFAAGFPEFGTSLHKILVTREFFDANPDLLRGFEDPLPWPEPGEWLKGFALLEELGRGSFVRVFLAQQPDVAERHVVVKFSFDDAAPEADALGSLSHPNIVPILSLHRDEAAGWTAVCMPYHGTATLADVLGRLTPGGRLPRRARALLDAIRETPLAPQPTREGAEPNPVLARGSYLDGALLLGGQLADAVAYVHEHGICHRDLKPANVLLTPNGRPLLLDFNLSCAEESADRDLGGTLPYMAPEQIRALLREGPGEPGGLDSRCDVFALGVILHQLLTGRHPFMPFPEGMPRRELARWLLGRHQAGAAPVRRLNPGIDRAVARVLDRCLAHDPARRPSARELADALRRALTPTRRAARAVLAHPRALAVVAAAALCALVFTLVGLAKAGPAPARHFQAGQNAYREGRHGEAVEQFSRVLEQEGKSVRVLTARGRGYYRLGKLNQAINDFGEADELGRDAKGKAVLGTCFLPEGKRQDYQAAINYYREALKAGYRQAWVYNNLGYSLARRNHFAEAREALGQALELDPELQAAYQNRAQLRIRFQGPSPGCPVATLDDVPENPQRSLAILLDEAIPDLRKALDLGPESGELHLYTARAYAAAAQLRPAVIHGPAITPDPGLCEQGLHHLKRALALGYRSEELEFRSHWILRAGLGHLPAYDEILRHPPTGNPAARKAVRFLEPIDD